VIFAHAGIRTAAARAGLLLLSLVLAGCATAPGPTAASLALQTNPQATVEGRVVDSGDRPVAGIRVYGLPHGKDIPWSRPAVTDADGRFRLLLYAPAKYGFFLRWNGRTVMTPARDDPARVLIAVQPGKRLENIELTFRPEAWEGAD
jgi:hypothetical protein